MKNKIILSAFALSLFLLGCGESTACKDLVWEAPESNQVVGLRISAGDKCENYNDYYEGDLNKIQELLLMNRTMHLFMKMEM
jgi:hypothetical protein